jgi:hypothetical protein
VLHTRLYRGQKVTLLIFVKIPISLSFFGKFKVKKPLKARSTGALRGIDEK